jgi:hypothetical protein
VVPDHYNSQDLNRYAYVRNNPIKYNDPSGHRACGDGEEIDCNGRKYEKPVIQEPPLGDSHFIVGVMIPDTMLKPLGESDPTVSKIPFLDAIVSAYEFPYYGLMDATNSRYFAYAEKNLPPNVWLTIDYSYNPDRFNISDLHIYNTGNYNITVSNVGIYVEPNGNYFGPYRVDEYEERGSILSPNETISIHLQPTTTLSNSCGCSTTIGPSGLFNNETAYVSVYLAATTSYIRHLEIVIPGRTVGGVPRVR